MLEKTTPFFHLQYSEETTADLRGRQSVRTTFKLSERSIDALSILASQLGIKQKSLFDHLIEDTQALRMIASEFANVGHAVQRVAKTYVISRKTLESLERVSEQYNTPRDALVEYSIERILPLLVREKEKHIKRKILVEELQEYLHRGTALLTRAENDLGSDDPVFLEILTMIRSVNSCCRELDQCVMRGAKIEKF
jgi:predicted nucleic acid-binding protein